MRPLIILFAKAPIPGQVKTRLHREPVRAAALHHAFVEDTLGMLQELRQEADVELSTDVSTDAWSEFDFLRTVQASGDLGHRMASAFARTIAADRPRTLILGSDSPLLPANHIRELLASPAEVALGPVDDGGYYAIACRHSFPAMFRHIRWSSEAALLDTVAAAKGCGQTVEIGPAWFDVDRPRDLDRLLKLLTHAPVTSRGTRLLNALRKVEAIVPGGSD